MAMRSLRSPYAVRAAAFTLLLAAGLGLSGCDREDAADQALQQASALIQGLSPGGARPPSDDRKQETLKQVSTRLQSVSRDGNASQKAAASILLSQVEGGLASLPADKAIEFERDALNQLTVIRATLDRYLSASGRAAAAVFDPAPELAALAKQDEDRKSQIAAAEAKKAKLDDEIKRLKQESASIAAQAKTKLDQAGQLRQQAVNQSAIAGESLIKQAREISREADKLEIQSADLQARAEQLAPDVPAAQLEIDRLVRQGDLIAKAREDVNRRVESLKKEAADARADAAKSAEQIKVLAAALADLHGGELGKSLEAAIAGYTKAAGLAKSAVSENRAGANLAIGAAQQGLGDVQWGRAHGQLAYAETLQALANAKPALPEAAKYKEDAAAAMTAGKEAGLAAGQAYEAALNAFQNAGGGPEVAKRIESLKKRLGDAAYQASSGQIDVRPQPETPPPAEHAPAETPDTTSAAPAATDLSTPEGAVAAILALGSSRDPAALSNVSYFGSDADRLAAEPLLQLIAKFQVLNEAARAKFGKGLEGAAAALGGGAGLGGFTDASARAADAKIAVQGDAATVSFPGSAQTLPLKKQGDQWKLDFYAMMAASGATKQQLGMMGVVIGPMTSAIDAVVADLNAGKFATPEDAMKALGEKMAAAASGAIPGAVPGAAPGGRPGARPGGGGK